MAKVLGSPLFRLWAYRNDGLRRRGGRQIDRADVAVKRVRELEAACYQGAHVAKIAARFAS